MKFSVVTPSYNQGIFIERTVRSVLSQDGVELEYVVFDGASNDETVAILRSLGEAHPSRMRWTSEKDKGQAHAVNKGLAATSGEIIGWLNSDDVYYPESLRAVAGYFAEHPEIDVVYGTADHIDADDRPLDPYPTEPWNFDRMIETCIVCQPAAFFRRRMVERHGPLNDTLHYCMDYEYWIRLALAGARFGYLDRKLAGSRMYAQNKTLGSRPAVHTEINNVLKRHLGRVPDRWLYNYAHAVTEAHRDRVPQSRAFRLELAGWALLASLRWNHRISLAMCRTATRWCVA